MTNEPAHSRSLPPKVKSRARRLRRDSTGPERKLWSLLSGSQLAGLKFRRQHPIGPFVVDFYCHELKLALEVDGVSHHGRVAEDQRRSRYLEAQGLRVLRVDNDEVLKDPESVLRTILKLAGIPE